MGVANGGLPGGRDGGGNVLHDAPGHVIELGGGLFYDTSGRVARGEFPGAGRVLSPAELIGTGRIAIEPDRTTWRGIDQLHPRMMLNIHPAMSGFVSPQAAADMRALEEMLGRTKRKLQKEFDDLAEKLDQKEGTKKGDKREEAKDIPTPPPTPPVEQGAAQVIGVAGQEEEGAREASLPPDEVLHLGDVKGIGKQAQSKAQSKETPRSRKAISPPRRGQKPVSPPRRSQRPHPINAKAMAAGKERQRSTQLQPGEASVLRQEKVPIPEEG